MQKSTVVHTRITPEVKNECDAIFAKLGITTSYAISLFLNQVVLRQGLPFQVTLPDDDPVEFALAVNATDGKRPSNEAIEIMKLYAAGILDEESAEKAIKRLHNVKTK